MNNKKFSIMLSLIFIICLFSISAEAEQIAPPVEKMQIWIEATDGIELDGNKVNKWKDKSGNENHLVQSESNTRRPQYLEVAEGLKAGSSVKFLATQYLSVATDYSGDATFAIYFRPTNNKNGQTLFSSHSYVGSSITESGRIPFSIAENDDKQLVFKMATGTETEDEAVFEGLNVPVVKDEYVALYVTISGTTVTVYAADQKNQLEITEPTAQFSINESPYWESYSYCLSYDTSSRLMGMQSEIVESMIYSKALSLEDINKINKYLKLKYEYVAISSIKLKKEISQMEKNQTEELEVIGQGNLMGVITEEDVTEEVEIISSDSNVISVSGNTLKAENFGTARITVSYKDLESIDFLINVPQTTIEDAVISELQQDGTVNCTQTLMNFAADEPVSVTMVGALYKGDLLLDVQFDEKENITDSYTFEVDLKKPDDVIGCSIYLMLLDKNTMTPITEYTTKEVN